MGAVARLPSSLTWASIRTRSTVPWKAFSSPTGICSGTTPRPNFLLERLDDAVEGGPLAVHPVDDEDDRPAELGRELPDPLGLDLDARDRVEDDEGGVGGVDRRARFGGEDSVAGGVQEVDPGVAVHGVRDRRG